MKKFIFSVAWYIFLTFACIKHCEASAEKDLVKALLTLSLLITLKKV